MAIATGAGVLMVKQQKEMLEIFTGFETKNRFKVTTPEDETVAFMFEESRWYLRMFLGNHRPLRLRILDGQGQAAATAQRRFFWFWSHLDVRDGHDQSLGFVQRHFSFLKRRYSLTGTDGELVGSVRGGLFKPNTFTVEHRGVDAARITKQWGGAIKEMFTKADRFQVEFLAPADERFRTLVLALAFALDLDYFESGSGVGGPLGPVLDIVART